MSYFLFVARSQFPHGNHQHFIKYRIYQQDKQMLHAWHYSIKKSLQPKKRNICNDHTSEYKTLFWYIVYRIVIVWNLQHFISNKNVLVLIGLWIFSEVVIQKSRFKQCHIQTFFIFRGNWSKGVLQFSWNYFQHVLFCFFTLIFLFIFMYLKYIYSFLKNYFSKLNFSFFFYLWKRLDSFILNKAITIPYWTIL